MSPTAVNILSSKSKKAVPRNLGKVILVEKSVILPVWIRRIKSLGGSYVRTGYAELFDLCEEFFNALIEVLERNNFLSLRRFIEKLCHIRSSQGFRLSEVQRAYYSFFDVVKPIIKQLEAKALVPPGTLNTISDILLETMFELSEAYHRKLDGKIYNYIHIIEEANLELKKISTIDELTGCYNYRYFIYSLNSEIYRAKRYNRPLSLVMFDIDNFKGLNDKFGHLFGDKVLKKMGEVLRKTLRSSDAGFRYGGEEFSIILPETEREKAFISAERIRKEVSNTPFNIEDELLRITISGGVEGFSDKPLDKNSLIARADKALYLAKNNGRNQAMLYSQ